jgi:hypothetical protein
MSGSAKSVARAPLRTDLRVLIGLLQGKPLDLPTSFENAVINQNMKRLGGIVRKICDDPSKLQDVEVVLDVGTAGFSSKKKPVVDESPHFDTSKVCQLIVRSICVYLMIHWSQNPGAPKSQVWSHESLVGRLYVKWAFPRGVEWRSLHTKQFR